MNNEEFREKVSALTSKNESIMDDWLQDLLDGDFGDIDTENFSVTVNENNYPEDISIETANKILEKWKFNVRSIGIGDWLIKF